MGLRIEMTFPLICIMLVLMLSICYFPQDACLLEHSNHKQNGNLSQEFYAVKDKQTGVLDPVLVEHIATPAWPSTYATARTDVSPTPGSVVYLPAGASGNQYSAECVGGHFLVGSGGSTSFASPVGTISLWLKWDLMAPNGRFWGQHANFETRWTGNRLALDWGSDNTLIGTKSSWSTDHWYFIAITWDQTINSLAAYWGDEDTEPVEEASLTWSGSVSGLFTQNCIMSSRGSSSYRVDGHVDEFRYYSIQRSLDDLRSDYMMPLAGSESGLVHYYQFEDTLTDSADGTTLVPAGDCVFSHDVPLGTGGWKAGQISIDIRDLELLSVLNGSLDNGIPGTAVDWTGDASCYPYGWRARREIIDTHGYQRVSYSNSDPNYVTMECEGYENVSSPGIYRYYSGTKIYWYQFVNNSDDHVQFQFSMKYLYERGPIGQNYGASFKFGFQIMNGSSILWNWSIGPTNITQRDVWNEADSMVVDLPEGLSTFEVRACFMVDANSTYIDILDTDPDLDGDPANARYITFLVDDISLTTLQHPRPADVDLHVSVEPMGDFSIQGESNSGTICLNNTYWEKAAIPFAFTSNASIIFEYSASVTRMTRFYNSSFSTSLDELGVAYEIELNQNAKLFIFTYIVSYPEAKDLGFVVHYPVDWYGPSVEDPIGNDLTTEALAESGCLEIPSGVASTVGWWKVQLMAQNYLLSMSTQVLREPSSTWKDEAMFQSSDRIRCDALIGAVSELTSPVFEVKADWYLPNGALWFSETVVSLNTSSIQTEGVTLGPNNATIGEWMVSVSWQNGTELAFGSVAFELYHRLTVFAQTPSIDIEPGELFTATISLYDQDNGNPILSGASVVGNWSTHNVQFNPNLAKGWWEADFNSSLVGTGEFVLLVSVSMPYYEMNNCSINVSIPVAESLFIITARATLLGALAVFAAFAVITVSRRIYVLTTSHRNLELLALRGRLEDARNLIGILVIHRSIGLPVYSRILKGGFQESLLSSFIAALSQFRAEFSWDEPKWTAIPITEVITAVQTEVLICAMITVEPATLRQKNQLELFGRNIGQLYDFENETVKQLVNSPNLYQTIDPIFHSHFDGALMNRYVGVSHNLPEHLNPVRETMATIDLTEGATPEFIVRSMTLLGHNDRKSHNLVLEAIDGGYLIASERVVPSKAELEH